MTQSIDTAPVAVASSTPITSNPFRPHGAFRAAPEPESGPDEPLVGFDGVDQLLRRPVWFIEAAGRQHAPAQLVRALLITILAGAGIFGAAMGAFRPGPQIISSAIKLPLVLLLTAGLAAPAFSGARWAAGAAVELRKDLLLFLSTLGLTSLVLAASAPVVLLVVLTGVSYHAVILCVVACCAAAGLVGMMAFAKAARRRTGPGRLRGAVTAALVFAVVGMQMAWTLRPFVARPRADFAVIRSMEGSFMDSVSTSVDSAQGRYERDYAPLPEDAR